MATKTTKLKLIQKVARLLLLLHQEKYQDVEDVAYDISILADRAIDESELASNVLSYVPPISPFRTGLGKCTTLQGESYG